MICLNDFSNFEQAFSDDFADLPGAMTSPLPGRWAPFLLRNFFLCYRNALRVVSIGFTPIATANKEVAGQGLYRE